ncbi:MAG TPA: GNAT family N-acetyltransferase [Solirubrobacterales bacterium]|nr:GNAT family N-acetyltransferase [Solirubrobacterales bacterium]
MTNPLQASISSRGGSTANGAGGTAPSISVVVPVFNGSATLEELAQRCRAVLSECASSYELVMVDDGSSDASWDTIERLAAADPAVRGVRLARNYGQHNALLAGIRAARNELVATIDDDLQNPPEEIPTLLTALDADVDVVYGEPVAKRQGLGRRLATQVVVRALRVLGGRTAPMVSAFRVFRTEVRDGFADYTGPDVSIDGLLTWRTDRFVAVPVRHDPRAHGSSNYSLLKLIKHALTMITAFSTRPLHLASGLGFLVILFGVFVLAYVLVRFVVDGGSVPGFPFLASIISIFSGAQLFAIGVIGEYLARVHVRVMSRPSYAVQTTVGGGEAPATSRDGTSPPGTSADAASGDREPPPCEVLDWDTELWGFPVARVLAERLDQDEARRIAAWGDQAGVRCTFLLAGADDGETAEAARAVGFWPVDSRVTLRREPGAAPRDGGAGGDAVEVRLAGEADRAALTALAREAHTDTRFFFDRGFPREGAEELYERWLARGFESPEREVLVADRRGEAVGYVIVSIDPPAIELIAVAQAARGEGVGRALVAAVIDRYPDSPVTVVTQGRNVAALRLYEAAGFRVTSSQAWYHRWS